jgi:sugar phosphate isomerase/epimerase
LQARAAGLAPTADLYYPFKMGLQSYSLRGYTRDGRPDVSKALAVTRDLGLHYWESYTAHVPMTADSQKLSERKREIAAADVSVIGYGVVALTKDADANRRIFDFARAMGLKYLSASPEPGCFDLLDRLVEEYDVAVGIHNHGPGDRYAKIETIAQAIKDHHPKIGCCIDTGHFLRSREDPVHAVEVFGKRVYGVHLKDVKDATTFTILGQGDLRTADLLKALARNKYEYCLAIEYEEKPEDPAEDIKACLTAVRAALAESRKA